MSPLILILGGARSGKSHAAETLALHLAGPDPVLFVATARADDDEMRARIARHQRDRPPHWRTAEEPLDVARVIRAQGPGGGVILLDCVTLLVANHLTATLPNVTGDLLASDDEARAGAAIDAVITDLLTAHGDSRATLIVVSNEVGMGIVPAHPLSRAYRDLLGRANARLAAAATDVYLMVAGLPIEIKHLAAPWLTPPAERE